MGDDARRGGGASWHSGQGWGGGGVSLICYLLLHETNPREDVRLAHSTRGITLVIGSCTDRATKYVSRRVKATLSEPLRATLSMISPQGEVRRSCLGSHEWRYAFIHPWYSHKWRGRAPGRSLV